MYVEPHNKSIDNNSIVPMYIINFSIDKYTVIGLFDSIRKWIICPCLVIFFNKWMPSFYRRPKTIINNYVSWKFGDNTRNIWPNIHALESTWSSISILPRFKSIIDSVALFVITGILRFMTHFISTSNQVT